MKPLRIQDWLVIVIIVVLVATQFVLGRPNTPNTEKPTMSVWARKAGGNWRPELAPKAPETPRPIPDTKPVTTPPIYSEEVGPRKRKCGRNQFWHAGGHKCVPRQCPGGNIFRNATGECSRSHAGYEQRGSEQPRYFSRHGHHTKRPVFRRGKLIIG